MKERIIRYDMKGEFRITETEKAEGMRVVLMDDKNTPCARYEFEGEKLNDIVRIQYHSNNIIIK